MKSKVLPTRPTWIGECYTSWEFETNADMGKMKNSIRMESNTKKNQKWKIQFRNQEKLLGEERGWLLEELENSRLVKKHTNLAKDE